MSLAAPVDPIQFVANTDVVSQQHLGIPPTPGTSSEVVAAEQGSSAVYRILSALEGLRTFAAGRLLQQKRRRLRVSETVSLGEKRFISIVEVDGTAYLIGGGSAGVSLLTQLAPVGAERTFQQVSEEAWQRAETA